MQFDHNRRAFIALLGGAAAAWPLSARAQQTMPVIGFLNSGSAGSRGEQFAAFDRGMGEAGYVDGQNVTIEYRWANDDYGRLHALAAELVRLPVEVLVAGGGPVSALAAKAATKTIPIVFTIAADPVKSGLVSSFHRPGGNITGTGGLTSELDAKRLELLHRLLPKASVIGVLVNPNRPAFEDELRELQAKAGDMKLKLVVQKAGAEGEIDAAIEALTRQKVGALLITADPFFNSRRAQVIAVVTRYAIPAIYQWREFAAAGGLMSYGPSIVAAYHQAGVYVGRILKGAKLSDLPVVRPTRFQLVINLKTAKTLGIEVPPTLLARADEVIE
ncbi:MAG TPA: ABC transporter substrate-binding protein [Xanthobacteraceae bacterium]|nr:ABC transporter substrate-binding protein [Xanthobacteraceae bacterium]